MKTFPLFLAIGITILSATPAWTSNQREAAVFSSPVSPVSDMRLIPPRQEALTGERADTTWFGGYELIGDEYYALPSLSKEEVMWTFDRGIGPFGVSEPVIENGGGWQVHEVGSTHEYGKYCLGESLYFRVIDASLDLGEGVEAPVISGERSLWVGADAAQALDLCWDCGAGYGDWWCQRVESEEIPYGGSGDVALSFLYWSNAEPCIDGTQVYLKRSGANELLLNPYPAGQCEENVYWTGGTFTDSIGHHSAPAVYERVITEAEIGGSPWFRIILEFTSDNDRDDKDCLYPTVSGPFGADSIWVRGPGIEDRFYDFEDGLQNWEAILCPSQGTFVDITDIGCYTVLDPFCTLDDNILEMHIGQCNEGEHPRGQRAIITSPICDVLANHGPGLKTIFMEFDYYADLPFHGGVLFRPGWLYYPEICDLTGERRWSCQIGQGNWHYWTDAMHCWRKRSGGTELDYAGTPIPAHAEKVIAVIELWSNCEYWDFPPEDCMGTNFTPLFDNLAVGVTAGPEAPNVVFGHNMEFQDVGSYPSPLFDPSAPGPANVVYARMPAGSDERTVCADSLVVDGPTPDAGDPSTRWEARLWWRVARRAPLQTDYENGTETRYKIWRDRVSDGLPIDRPDNPLFTFGWMDSVQDGYVTLRDQFVSAFREDDDDFAGEGTEENEMLWDDIFYPGTCIEYFVTSNYTHTPHELHFLPDTSGGYFYDLEILPGLRTAHVPDCGGAGSDYCVYQPATLLIDSYFNNKFVTENALATILNGADPCQNPVGCPVPRDRNWDRYDYLGAGASHRSRFARGTVAGSNNGMTLSQILGYRTLLVHTSVLPASCMDDRDFELFDDWLHNPACEANVNRQVLALYGDNAGELLESPGWIYAPAFLHNTLGATLLCDAFNGNTDDADCGEINASKCVRWMPVLSGPFDTEIDVDLWGNRFVGSDVFSPNGGTGNRYYSAEDGLKEMAYAQIVNEDLGPTANYRTILGGSSLYFLTARDGAAEDPDDRCAWTIPTIIAAITSELGAALKWGFDAEDYASIPALASAQVLAECQETWDFLADADEAADLPRINRLYQNRPNPFNPETTIRFSLAWQGQVEVAIYDVGGRLVRTLMDEDRQPGLHSVVWDGADDGGHPAGSGVYWCQMRTDGFLSNKKMVVLK